MKYERLAKKELEKLREEFVDFLVITGCSPDEWQGILESEPHKRDKILDHFSDVIWESVLNSAHYIEMHCADSLYCFHCKKNKIHLIKLKDENPGANLLDPEYRQQAIQSGKNLILQRSSKSYQKDRQLELFELIKQGAFITDGHLYLSLSASQN